MPQIIPAILTNSKEELRQKISLLEKIVPRAQIDIIDGKFTDNKTVGIEEIGRLDTPFFVEAHLMVNDPEQYIDNCLKANIKLITVHLESINANLESLIGQIRFQGMQTGIAINPETPLESIKPFADIIDLILIMSVPPGFGGQEFMASSLKKIKAARALFSHLKIEVDGGINIDNARNIAEAGADYLVIGSSLFKNGNTETAVQEAINQINSTLESAYKK